MSEIEYPQSNYKWAQEKGLIRKCPKHGINYDTHIGCLKCKDEEEHLLREAKESAEDPRPSVFDNVIWPDHNL